MYEQVGGAEHREEKKAKANSHLPTTDNAGRWL